MAFIVPGDFHTFAINVWESDCEGHDVQTTLLVKANFRYFVTIHAECLT